ncbi:DUF5132 domain-containing protein [Streptomyces acidiscabies]|uniref:DUF5132 domain-containing protein n=3 Tax=Streptomyces acidiscabies TaxID=42234 RepID=A0AAP6EFU7_9ACTN|nr:DUF5132 domain-containing protein [Streptomyces acidiscabies]MBP5935647.1 DUF5132 domain-containing protein [Streptomyces sp. LBUM 1476]MBZ3916468.1 DUF5132 domain-containing protein [Streptomyces acidiscabies]MDX2961159.1 DUF5132 domain-containing protein [Streptomyces acidiscabies]MDX3022887.1 DUF5132 domain-containing protein [Streptomyces acidiscabies]MDX3791866.1 DUF5132 domain-containing protein [Streptomyces acidiscabies]
MPPVVPPFLIGLIAAPLAKRIVAPLMKGLVKTSVGLVMEVKRAAHEATEGLHDLAAEVTAEVMAAQLATGGAPAAASVPTAAAAPVAADTGAAKTAPPKARPAGGAGKTH